MIASISNKARLIAPFLWSSPPSFHFHLYLRHLLHSTSTSTSSIPSAITISITSTSFTYTSPTKEFVFHLGNTQSSKQQVMKRRRPVHRGAERGFGAAVLSLLFVRGSGQTLCCGDTPASPSTPSSSTDAHGPRNARVWQCSSDGGPLCNSAGWHGMADI